MVNLTSNTFGASAVYLRGNNHVITNNIINTAFFLGDNIQGCNDTLMQSNTFAPGNLNINAPSISKASNLTIRSNTFTSSSFDVVVVSNAQNSFIAHNNIKSNDNSAPLTLADTTSGFTIYNNNFTSNKNVVDNGTNNKWNFF